MTEDYNPAENTHTYAGAHAALSVLFPDRKPASLLDVGCGPGAWLRAATDLGIQDAVGVDGLDLEADRLFVPKSVIQVHDLDRPLDLGRMFELALCLEVAEHLSTEAADGLVKLPFDVGITLHLQHPLQLRKARSDGVNSKWIH
jgi:hypothetical protein